METFWFILLIPVVIAFIAKAVWKHSITWKEMGAQMAIVSLITATVYMFGMSNQTQDYEIWNGTVTGKERVHDYYEEAYDCFCVTTCSGSGKNETCTETCQTCYEDHYTVSWDVKTTLGEINIKYLDKTSKSVYKTPDPTAYTKAYKGEPCSTVNSYVNYIKAVPESIFNTSHNATMTQFASMIPAYPELHSYYKVNRVLSSGVPLKETAQWNHYLSEKLRTIGPKKQANIILVFAKTADTQYRYALEQSWLGGKKNDVIVIAGVTEYPKIDFIETITLGQNAGNSLMTVEMRDNLMKLGSVEDYKKYIDAVANVVLTRFDRKPMQDYDYLKDDIKPSDTVIAIAIVLSVLLSIGLTVYFHKKDVF